MKKKPSFQLGWMMIISVITQFIAIFKSTVTASNFGACVELDAYNFANNLSTFFLTFVSSGITTVIIPAYIKKKDKKAINTFISVIFFVVGILLLLMFLFRGLLVDILTNREAEFKAYVCNLLLLTILIQLLPAVLGVTTAYFQTEGKYNIPKVILMLSNLGVAIVLLSLKSFSIYEYLYILLAGAVFQFVVDLVIAIKCGFRFFICFDMKNGEYKKLRNVFLPTVFSSGIYKINTMIDSLLSSNLGVGQLTMLSYSNTMVGMVNNMFISNLSTYAYPKIVQAVSISNEKGQKELWKYSNMFHSVMCLIIAGFIIVGREFIAVLYERGKFTSDAADVVYICLCIYLLGLQNNVVRDLVYRYFYANGNTKAATKNSFITSIVNALTSIVLAQFIGLYGLVVGTVLSGTWSLITIMFRLRNIYGILTPLRPVIKEFAKDFSALIISVLVCISLKKVLPQFPDVITFLIFGCLTVIIYSILLIIERSNLFVLFSKKVRR